MKGDNLLGPPTVEYGKVRSLEPGYGFPLLVSYHNIEMNEPLWAVGRRRRMLDETVRLSGRYSDTNVLSSNPLLNTGRSPASGRKEEKERYEIQPARRGQTFPPLAAYPIAGGIWLLPL